MAIWLQRWNLHWSTYVWLFLLHLGGINSVNSLEIKTLNRHEVVEQNRERLVRMVTFYFLAFFSTLDFNNTASKLIRDAESEGFCIEKPQTKTPGRELLSHLFSFQLLLDIRLGNKSGNWQSTEGHTNTAAASGADNRGVTTRKSHEYETENSTK